MKIVLVIFALVVLNQSARIQILAQNFRKCNRTDPDFKKCFFEAFQHAYLQLTRPFKALNIPNLAPLEVEQLDIEIRRDKVTLSTKLRKCQIFGFDRPSKIVEARFDFQDKALWLAVSYPRIKLSCDYKMNGKILFLPVAGEGLFKLDSKNFGMVANLTYTESVRNGQTYIEFVNGSVDVSNSDVYCQIDNLFNGDKDLGERMNKVINDNWKDLYEEVKADLAEGYVKILKSLLNPVFSKISLEDAFDNK